LITSFIIASLVSTVRKQKEEMLSSVNHKVIEAEERERQRIANDLHEDIGQRVTLLVIQIEQLKEGSTNGFEMRSRIDGILKECLQVLTDVKALAHELYSPRLEYLGIAGIMNSFCTDFRARNGVEIDFQSDGSTSFVPPNISLCLLRVLQEALHNAVKHSGVRRFDVHLNGTSDEIHLAVRDCGAGFNPKKDERRAWVQPHAGATQTPEGQPFRRVATQAWYNYPRLCSFAFRKRLHGCGWVRTLKNSLSLLLPVAMRRFAVCHPSARTSPDNPALINRLPRRTASTEANSSLPAFALTM